MNRTSCAKHQETNVSSCASEVKDPTLQLLYGRTISIHMAYDIRDLLLALVLRHPTLSAKTKNWFTTTFGTDEGMMVSVHSPICCRLNPALQMNTQAFRNFLTTCGYCADTMIELLFRNTKGTKELRWCTLATAHVIALTRTCSAELKRALLHETLDRHFTFVDVRLSNVAIELQKLLNSHKFMDMDAPTANTYKLSTYHRWQEQVSECTLQGTRSSRISSDLFDVSVHTYQANL